MASSNSRARILVVDDEPLVRQGVARFLASAGYSNVVSAANNAEVRSLVSHSPFDLVISDLNRPDGTGVELVRELRSTDEMAHTRIIILTGNPTAEKELACWRLGIQAFLLKPIGPAELCTAVEGLLARNLDADRYLLDLGIEGRDLDYKRALDLSRTATRAEFARDVLAFANSGGGAIVVGVDEPGSGEFKLVGVPDAELEQYEVTRLNDAIRRYVASAVSISSRVVRRDGLAFVVVRVGGVEDTLALALSGHEGAGLHTGRIYVRGDDARCSELTDPTTLRRIIDRLVEARLRRLLTSGGGLAR
jgi:two-component system, chemotaxis family, chemotaxis protein CheY